MLTSLNIENFRVFDSFKVEELGQVNLFVGANNCGKTSLLEAVELLASRGLMKNTLNSSWRRSEATAIKNEIESRKCDIRNIFHGFKEEKGFRFKISGQEMNHDEIFIAYKVDKKTDETSTMNLIVEYFLDGVNKIYEIPLTEHYRVPFKTLFSWDKDVKSSNVNFITLSSLNYPEIKILWENIASNSLEDAVRKMVEIIEPRMQNIVVEDDLYSTKAQTFGGIKVKLYEIEEPIYLGSLGGGFQRVLSIAAAALCSENGYLLIDEIDTGLHYSIMDDLWQMVIETAEKLKFQVFATTHSNDCIEGLAWLINKEPKLCDNVRLHRIEKDLKRTIVYTPNDISVAADHHLELR